MLVIAQCIKIELSETNQYFFHQYLTLYYNDDLISNNSRTQVLNPTDLKKSVSANTPLALCLKTDVLLTMFFIFFADETNYVKILGSLFHYKVPFKINAYFYTLWRVEFLSFQLS